MAASVYDLYIEQGATYRMRVRLYDADNQPLDITGYTARSQIRQAITTSAFIHEMTTENGGIVVNGAGGYLDLSITDLVTKGFKFTSPAVWDIELVAPVALNSVVTRLLKGNVYLDPEVTR